MLLDHCTPRPLLQFLRGHEVTTAEQHGWEELTNGDLLDAADECGSTRRGQASRRPRRRAGNERADPGTDEQEW